MGRLDSAAALRHVLMMRPTLELLADAPSADQRDQLLKLLLDFNGRYTGHIVERPDLGILLRHPDTAEIVGGLYASDEYNWLFIKYLVVPDALRGQGLGRALMTEAERVARERGYLGIFLDTFDFQARPFYLKLGFEQFGELEGNADTPRRFFLKKVL